MVNLTIEYLRHGDGVFFPKPGDAVKIHYTGKLQSGLVFDSSVERNDAFIMIIGRGRAIRGWEEAILQISLGSKVLLTVPPELAYGSRGFPPHIPPNATLLFEVELLELNGLGYTDPISTVGNGSHA
ncbi:FK506-binding protein 1 [Peniophora sp. CONT]|nr:FK506-binding protein 1 [Peniophora sp. CONT]